MKHAFVLGLAVLLGGCAAATQSNAPADIRIMDDAARARLDAALAGFVERGSVAGASALVWEKGREEYFGAFGQSDRNAGVPMSRSTIVQIFSMTKPIVGVALMQLYEAGAFDLDDPLSKYLPEFADTRVYAGEEAGGGVRTEPLRRPITIRDLTRHTAGFATGEDNPGVGPLLRAANPFNRTRTLADGARALAGVPLWFQPGERWAYGPSVDVQAALVERISGQPFAAYLEQHIFAPLGMRETRYVVPESDRGRFASMYQKPAGGALVQLPELQAKLFNLRSWPLTPGGYGLISTLDDYMRFARMLANGGVLDGVRILRPETVRLMATNQLSDSVTERSWLPSKGQVGFGIDFAVRVRPTRSPDENHGVVGEFFWDGAASTLFWVDPVHQLTAVLFVQVLPFDGALHRDFRNAVYGPWQPRAR